MAKHKLSAMFSDLRGKLNGSKFSKGRSAHTLTNKVKGSNPQTSYQMLVRSYFREYTSMWKTLTDDQILAWNSAAQDSVLKNAFGDSYKITGHKLFVKINVNAKLFGGAEALTPVDYTVPDIVNIENLASDPITHAITLDTDIDLPAGCALVIKATRPMSPGKTNVKGNFRTIEVYPAPFVAGSHNITFVYTARFGALPVGKKIHVAAYTTDDTKHLKFRAGNELATKLK